MLHLSRPWDGQGRSAFGINDCLISEATGAIPRGVEHSVLMRSVLRGTNTHLLLHPYPRKGHGDLPPRSGFPVRPRTLKEQETEEEAEARACLRRMNEVLARVQELGDALDDPLNVWPRLRLAWERAENEENPRMAEIVKQAREVLPCLRDLEARIRRVLRRARERISLDRVQEMDRASMLWLVRQPGRTIAERAGASQRILATVRRENFDTPENRVVHAYTLLASDIARQWMKEHPKAKESSRYQQVEAFAKFCLNFAKELEKHEVRVADAGITPNYVLMQDPGYSRVYEAWKRLLQNQMVIDDLWAWQAETWTDFCVLAIVLSLADLDDAELIAQSPIVWRSEATLGRWFNQDRPIAVFWLKSLDRIVEVQARPEAPGMLLGFARAHVALRISDVRRLDHPPRRVAVWTPHALARVDLDEGLRQAHHRLLQIQQLSAAESLRHGLILTPAHGSAQVETIAGQRTQIQAIALDASGDGLRLGLKAIQVFARSEIYRVSG